jgi:hypothetical protein
MSQQPQPSSPDPHWAATRMQTAMATRMAGEEAYLGRNDRILGTRVGDNAHEMFAICPAGEALQLHFEQHAPNFIAVHDVGSTWSPTFLHELGAALKLPPQVLTIRRQGTGVALATLQFIELPSQRGRPVRVYITAVDADTATRKHVADTLLAFSRLGVLLVDAMPDHMLGTQFNLLRDRMMTVPWNNRDLLMVPRGEVPRLGEHGQRLVDGSLVHVRSAPRTTQTATVWRAIHESWSALRAEITSSFAPLHAGTTPSPQAMAPRPMPTVAPSAAAAQAPAPSTPLGQVGGAPITLRPFGAPGVADPAPPATGAAGFAQACAALRGAVGCVVFDRTSRHIVALSSNGVDPSNWIPGVAVSLKAANALNDALGGSDATVESVATLERHVILSRTIARHPNLGIAIGFDKAQANLVLHRAQLQRLDAMLDQ